MTNVLIAGTFAFLTALLGELCGPGLCRVCREIEPQLRAAQLRSAQLRSERERRGSPEQD